MRLKPQPPALAKSFLQNRPEKRLRKQARAGNNRKRKRWREIIKEKRTRLMFYDDKVMYTKSFYHFKMTGMQFKVRILTLNTWDCDLLGFKGCNVLWCHINCEVWVKGVLNLWKIMKLRKKIKNFENLIFSKQPVTMILFLHQSCYCFNATSRELNFPLNY